MEFLRSFLRRHLAGKPVVASPNVGCFLRLQASSKSDFHFTICSLHELHVQWPICKIFFYIKSTFKEVSGMSEANTSNFNSGQNICSLLFEGSWLLIFALWSQKQAQMWQFLFHLL